MLQLLNRNSVVEPVVGLDLLVETNEFKENIEEDNFKEINPLRDVAHYGTFLPNLLKCLFWIEEMT